MIEKPALNEAGFLRFILVISHSDFIKMSSAPWRKTLNMESEITPKPFPDGLFIVGCHRSGTSMLVDKLTQHPQLFKVGVELNDIWTAIGGAQCKGLNEYRDEKDANFQAANNMTHYFSRFIDESKSFRRHLMRSKNWFTSRKGSIFYDWDHVIPVNKSPNLTNKIGYIHTLFPGFKVILIVRSILGHSSSAKVFFNRLYENYGMVNYIAENPKDGYIRIHKDETTNQALDDRIFPGDFSIIPYLWIRLNRVAMEDIVRLPEEQRLIISYEDFVRYQDHYLERIFDFLEVLPRHNQATQKIIHSGMKIINTSTKGDPLEKWKTQLTHEEISQVERVVAENREDYDFIENSLNKLALKVDD